MLQRVAIGVTGLLLAAAGLVGMWQDLHDAASSMMLLVVYVVVIVLGALTFVGAIENKMDL